LLTGPASVDPRTGDIYRLTFPVLSLEDVARGGFEVIKHLGVNRLVATVGPSMGGMTALAFEILFPGVSDGFVSMSSGARSLPFSIALRSTQREMIRRDPAWMGGNYPRDAQPLVGMRLARKLGMITYRSAEEWRLRFGRSAPPHMPTPTATRSVLCSRSRTISSTTHRNSRASSTPTVICTYRAPVIFRCGRARIVRRPR
jgi:homoserine O-acetyltransferase